MGLSLRRHYDVNIKGICLPDIYSTHFEFCQYVTHPSLNGLNIPVLTMELYLGEKYAVGKKCFHDIVVSYLMYGERSMILVHTF